MADAEDIWLGRAFAGVEAIAFGCGCGQDCGQIVDESGACELEVGLFLCPQPDECSPRFVGSLYGGGFLGAHGALQQGGGEGSEALDIDADRAVGDGACRRLAAVAEAEMYVGPLGYEGLPVLPKGKCGRLHDAVLLA